MNKTYKVLGLLSVFALLLAVTPVTLADTTVPVITGLTRDTSGGAAPIVKAKWEANGADAQGVAYTSALEYYRDDATTVGAQFNPSGKYQVNKKIAMCAVVTDPDGLADIQNVYADVFYPEVGLGDHHVPLADQSGEGCGELMQEDSLRRLSKADGIELFCNRVRTSNNNLPTFNTTPMQYTYDEICDTDGELQKETAAVYCGTKDLSYEDPSGNYKVWAIAQDQVGLQEKLENYFNYLPVVAFEADFNQVQYGNVRLNTHKIISGDLAWNTPVNSGKASVKNVGNTRISMKVMQDDMELGKTDGNWNVKYDARVGSSATFANYDPLVTKKLADPLDLSELDEMDFSIVISKFPPTHAGNSYTGNLTLTAVQEAHLTGTPYCPD